MELIARLLNSQQLMSLGPQPQGAQAAQASADQPSGAVLPTFEALLLPGDRSSWTEKGERTSVASEISFVSALSTGNTSIAEPTSPTRLNGVESDTDTSTAYESAGETEVNVSVNDDEFRTSTYEVSLDHPIAISSPLEGYNSEAARKKDERPIILNETIQLEDSSESVADVLSVSCLADHLGSLSLCTPLKVKTVASIAKAHVTLDSDVSGDLISSPGPDHDSDSITKTEASELLDATITLSHGDDEEFVNESVQEDPPKAEELNPLNEFSDVKGLDCTQTIDICVHTEAGDSVVALPDESVSEIAASELKALEELGESLNISALNASELSAFEAKLLEGFENSYHLSSESIKNPQGIIEEASLNETVVEVAKALSSESLGLPGNTPSIETENVACSTIADCLEEAEDPLSLKSLVISENTACAKTECVAGSPSSDNVASPQGALEENDLKFKASLVNSEVGDQDNFEPSPSFDLEDQQGKTEICEINSDTKAIGSQQQLESSVSQCEQTCSEIQEALNVSSSNSSEAQLESKADTDVVVFENTNTFEDSALPEKVQGFLANQLAAEEQTADCPLTELPEAVACAFDEAPLPAKKQRTFQEILAEELAAQNLTPAPVESEPASVSETSEGLKEIASNEALPEPDASTNEKPSPDEGLNCPAAELPTEDTEVVQLDAPCFEVDPDDVAIPIKPPRTFEEILEAQLAAQGDPALAVPSFSSSSEVAIPIKPRTFEEILAAELAAQSDPEQAVPSFSIQVSPRKLDESFSKIISSGSSSIESECASVLISEAAHGEPEHEFINGLDSLIEKCKQQEQDLELQDTDFKCVEVEANRLSLSCLNESQKTHSVASEESGSPDIFNQTVIHRTPVKEESIEENTEVKVESAVPAFEEFPGTVTFSEEDFKSGDAFKDPSAFDFLSQHGSTRSARDLRKESLYVKFDPLVGTLDSFSSMHPENSSDSQSRAPAVGDDRHQLETQHSDKLVSLSPSSSKQAHDDRLAGTPATLLKTSSIQNTPVKTPVHVMLNETLESIESRGVKQEDIIRKLQEHQSILDEQDKAYQERISELEQRLQEMALQKGDGLLSDKLQEHERQLQEKERQLQEKERQLQENERQLQEKTQSLGELNVIMKEYEKTISRLVAEKSQEKAGFDQKQDELIKERDQVHHHLNNMEIAFADIHTKYERIKSVVDVFKKNEETLNAALNEKEANFVKMQSMYDMLKSHAVSKLEKANQDLEAIKQKHQQENAKLKAMIKKLELKTKSLEDGIEQKVKENQALTAICDELINKVGE